MLLGYKEAQNINGYFREYECRVEVNDKVHYTVLFARNDTDAMAIVQEWQSKCTGTCSYYKYFNPEFTGIGKLKAQEIVERVYSANKYQYLLSYTKIGAREYIH